MTKLIGCEGCGRHVRASESACPFCGAARVASHEEHVSVEVPATSFGSRRRLMGFGVAVGAAAIATAAMTTGCAGPVYGAPTPEEDASAEDAGPGEDDGGGPVPAYGAPVP
jgi:hypothetical protein